MGIGIHRDEQTIRRASAGPARTRSSTLAFEHDYDEKTFWTHGKFDGADI